MRPPLWTRLLGAVCRLLPGDRREQYLRDWAAECEVAPRPLLHALTFLPAALQMRAPLQSGAAEPSMPLTPLRTPGGTGMPTITLRRRRQYFGLIRRLRVLIDGQEVEPLAFGERRTYEVTEGEHQVQVRMDWASSRVCRVFCSGDFDVELEVGTHYTLNPLALVTRSADFFYVRERGEVGRTGRPAGHPVGAGPY